MGEEGLNTIIKEKRKVTVAIKDKKYDIGKMSLFQTTAIPIFIAKIYAKGQDRLKNIKTDGKTSLEDVVNILKVLDENELAELMSILLNENDIEFCKDIDGEDALEVIAIMLEKTDIEKVKKNVVRIIASLKE